MASSGTARTYNRTSPNQKLPKSLSILDLAGARSRRRGRPPLAERLLRGDLPRGSLALLDARNGEIDFDVVEPSGELSAGAAEQLAPKTGGVVSRRGVVARRRTILSGQKLVRRTVAAAALRRPSSSSPSGFRGRRTGSPSDPRARGAGALIALGPPTLTWKRRRSSASGSCVVLGVVDSYLRASLSGLLFDVQVAR
jgi:hypothetical protein